LAVRTKCPCCGKPFSAPDEYRGKKVDCPKCGHRFVLKTPEELDAEKNAAEEDRRKQAEDRQRLALIESRELRDRGGVPYYERYQTGDRPVRNYDPKAPSRFSRMRALSDLLLAGAYIGLLLAAVGAGLTIYLRVGGMLDSTVLLLLCLVGWAIVGLGLFLGLKVLAELAFLLAFLADQQSDAVQLLLDIQENTDGRRSS